MINDSNSPFKVGSTVKWKWMGGYVDGTVVEIHFGPIEKELKGKKIKRNGSVEKPAYLVKSQAGNFALKLHSELVSGSGSSKPD
jgi:hypothetical protein